MTVRSMREAGLACFLLCTTSCVRGRPAKNGQPDLAIMYVSDLRDAVASPPYQAGGLARRAIFVDRARLTARAVVQVDAGDLVSSEHDEPDRLDRAALETRTRLALRVYRRMGVDAIAVGEREIALGAARWRALCEEAKVPTVAANIVGKDGQLLFPPDLIVRAGGVAVGIFGVLDLAPEQRPPATGVGITDPVAAARAAVRSLRARGARVIVGLFHVAGGLSRARTIADAAGDIDLVVLGHGDGSAPPRYVRAGSRGANVGRLDLWLAGGRPPHLEDHLLPYTPDVGEQIGVRMLVRVAAGSIAPTFAASISALKAAGVGGYGENWTYGSTAVCVGCHPAEAAQWKTTDHAHAFATLEEAGKATDPACLGCHSTGFLLPGGAQNLESAAQFQDVGCESCHGPSVAHVVSTDKRRGTSRRVDPIVCLGCHTPDQNLGPFNAVAAMKAIVGPGHGVPVSAGQ